MRKSYVLIAVLAGQLGIDRSTLFKWLKKNGFGDRMFDVRTGGSRGQAMKAVTPAMAREIIAERSRRGWEC